MSSRSMIMLSVIATAAAAGQPTAHATGCDPSLVDDSTLRINTVADANNMRTNVIKHIWGSNQTVIPTKMPTAIRNNVKDTDFVMGSKLQIELKGLQDELGSVVGTVNMIEYRMNQANGTTPAHTALGWYITPKSGARNQLVIVHQGHDNTLVDVNDPGDVHMALGRTMKNLLWEGYAVLGMYMPFRRPDDTTGTSHGTLMSMPVSAGSGLQFFIEPVAAFLQYAKSFNIYNDFHMVGLSGGGWTTTVYAAIDSTIEMSFPVSGTVPLYMMCTTPQAPQTYPADVEQKNNALAMVAGYKELYLLGSYGTLSGGRMRHQTQVLSRHDECCFGQDVPSQPTIPWEADISAYELDIRNRLFQLGQGGMFRVEIDENRTGSGFRHMVSTGTTFRTILGELNSARRVIGKHRAPTANSNDAFYRGGNGHLWHRTISPLTETDTGVVIQGVPESASAPSTGQFNVIARNTHGQPILIQSANGTSWTTTTFNGTINNDPTILTGFTGTDLWTFAIGTDYLPYVWDSAGNFTSIPGPPVLGPISASLRSAGSGFHIFYLGWDRTVRHAYRATTTAAWQTESLGGVTFGYPAGKVDSNGDLVVFQLGTDGLLYWKKKVSGDQTPSNPWTGWTSISQSASATSTILTGMPGFFGGSGAWTVFVPKRSGGLAKFTLASGSTQWQFADLGGTFTSPATTNSTGAFIRDRAYALWKWTTSGLSQVGGFFD
jgi:hypothetical protein